MSVIDVWANETCSLWPSFEFDSGGAGLSLAGELRTGCAQIVPHVHHLLDLPLYIYAPATISLTSRTRLLVFDDHGSGYLQIFIRVFRSVNSCLRPRQRFIKPLRRRPQLSTSNSRNAGLTHDSHVNSLPRCIIPLISVPGAGE